MNSHYSLDYDLNRISKCCYVGDICSLIVIPGWNLCFIDLWQDEVDVALIERLLHKLYWVAGERLDLKGSVLIFLPGWEDITRLRECLQASPLFGDASRFLLLPLHSLVPSSEQRRVFQSPPKGVCKIVMATNIAETAITIDDVVYVIDSGRMKEKSYDPYSNVSTLQVRFYMCSRYVLWELLCLFNYMSFSPFRSKSYIWCMYVRRQSGYQKLVLNNVKDEQDGANQASAIICFRG